MKPCFSTDLHGQLHNLHAARGAIEAPAHLNREGCVGYQVRCGSSAQRGERSVSAVHQLVRKDHLVCGRVIMDIHENTIPFEEDAVRTQAAETLRLSARV
jgi:hypothetical protein